MSQIAPRRRRTAAPDLSQSADTATGRQANLPPQSAPAPAAVETQVVYFCEADVAAGLEEVALAELRRVLGGNARSLQMTRTGVVSFEYTGDITRLLRPRTVLAIYFLQRFAVPRPKALLGDANFRRIVQMIATIRTLSPDDAYQTLYLSAAGSDSSVMNRLKEEIGKQAGLKVVSPNGHEGDLHLRVRRTPGSGSGWEVLARITPRPLGARPWRVRNMEGALNATVASAMVRLTKPETGDRFLNIACGSGTLLIERAVSGPSTRLLGCDLSTDALDAARENVAAAGYAGRIELRQEDARTLDLPDGSIDVICADLPFGNLVGSHDGNLTLYPALLAEAARVARPEARFVLITHEVRLMETLLEESDLWKLEETKKVVLGGLHPRIFVLRRNGPAEQ